MSSGQAPHVDPYADREFARVLASRRGADAPDVARVPELYLAFACARRDPAAIAWFDAHYLREVDAAASRFDTLPVSIDDVRQRAREKLYLSDPPALAGYQGRGELRGWVRAFALHMLINIVTREARERPTDDGFFDAVVDASPDVEAACLKQACREEFERAFAAALGTMPARERTLLKYAFADGMNVDQIGAVFRVHRATAARWVASARDRLVRDTRLELMRSLRIGEDEAISIVRVALSRMGTTLMRRLASA